jgi:hypothetical protein
MKRIPLRKGEADALEGITVFRQVLENSPREPLNVDMIRRRCRVLDKLEKAGGEFVDLEDLDALTLSQAIDVFPWSKATKDILAIIDDVKEAKEPPKPDAES